MKNSTFQCPNKVLLRLINAKIKPTQSETNISKVKGCLINPFLIRIKFDLENIMLEHMARVIPFGFRCLYYPNMITRLLMMHHMEEMFYYERMIQCCGLSRLVTSVIDPPSGIVATVDQRLVRVKETMQLLFADMHIRAYRRRLTWLRCSRLIPSLLLLNTS